jgi:hypothetical protein
MRRRKSNLANVTILVLLTAFAWTYPKLLWIYAAIFIIIMSLYVLFRKPKKRSKNNPVDFSDIIKGYRFCATLSIRTPLKYLKMHYKVIKGAKSKLPTVPQQYGIWIPEARSWKELGIKLKEPAESTMASEIGPVPESGGCFLEFLKRFRGIVESDMEPLRKKEEIYSIGQRDPELAKCLSKLQEQKILEIIGLKKPRQKHNN